MHVNFGQIYFLTKNENKKNMYCLPKNFKCKFSVSVILYYDTHLNK